MPDSEGPLVEGAKRYLKEHYGEDTVSMTVIQNKHFNHVRAHATPMTSRERVLAALHRKEPDRVPYC